jgi:hypothetical protein
MDELTFFCAILDDTIKLKRKPKVRQFKRKPLLLEGVVCEGLYHGTYNRNGKPMHRISICAGPTGEHLFAVLAHEYMHAWQMENEPNSDLGHTADENVYFKLMRFWIIQEFDIDPEGWY